MYIRIDTTGKDFILFHNAKAAAVLAIVAALNHLSTAHTAS